MNFVLDTNVISETRKPRPARQLTEWLEGQDSAHLFITTMTLAEVWFGFHSLDSQHPDYKSIRQFAMHLDENYRVLNFDSRAAAAWGRLSADASGPLPLRDSVIAAIAISRGYRLATRDSEAFERMGCKVVNPWK